MIELKYQGEKLIDLEKEIILQALKFNNYVVKKTADSLGIGRVSLYTRFKKHNISVMERIKARYEASTGKSGGGPPALSPGNDPVDYRLSVIASEKID